MGALLICIATAPVLAQAVEQQYGKVRYAAGRKVFQTGVFEPRLLAEIPNGATAPFLVMSGMGCDECDINVSIYIHSPAQGPMAEGERAERYAYPGQYRHYMTDELLELVRMFTGQCTEEGKPGVLWMHRIKLDSGGWRSVAFAVQIADGKLVARIDPAYEAVLRATRQRVAGGMCREIRGRQFKTEP